MDLTDLDTPAPAPIAPVATGLAKVQALRDRILERSLSVVDGVQSFADLSQEDLDSEAPPARWVAEEGEEAAARRFRLAKMGLASASEAPVGLKVATTILNGELKARAMEKQAPQAFFAVSILMPAAELDMPEIIITEGQSR